jgi:deoxyribose-phosphate aldolase
MIRFMTNTVPDQAEALRLASRIQFTIISNAMTQAKWEDHVAQCLKYHFHAAMIPPTWVRKTREALRGTGVLTASFVDFPYGTMTSAGKAYETAQLAEEGAEEIDFMPNVGFLLSGMEREYADDLRGVVRAAGRVPVKIMLELPLLNLEQKQRAVAISAEAGVTYMKNSSGGSMGVATPDQMEFLRRIAPPHIRLKASGGIKTVQQVRDLVSAGADVVGTSSGVRIMEEFLGVSASAKPEPSHY